MIASSSSTMAENSQLKVLEVFKVVPKPNQPNDASQTTLPLTFFDLLWLRFFPSQRLFFYETNADKETVVGKLKLSLSITLQNYLPLAGNLVWPSDSNKPVIQYLEGDAVSFTVGESGASFHDLASNNFREVRDFYHLVPELPNSETRIPVMSLQVTFFPDVGFCLGYAIHHAVADGKSVAMFMHSWAFICKSINGGDDHSAALTPELTPFYGRSLIKDPNNLEQRHMDIWLAREDESNKKNLSMLGTETTDDTWLGTMEMRMEDIENLKKSVSSNWQEKGKQEHQKTHVSSYTVTTAYVWVCLVRTRLGRMAAVENVDWSAEQHLSTMVDCRARMEPPIQSTYFGNCVTAIVIDVTLKDLLSEQGLAITARELGEAIEHLKDGVLKGQEKLLNEVVSYPPGSLFMVAGSSPFELYKTDFGWGTPTRVKLISNARSGAFSPCDSRNSKGMIEMGIVLKKNEVGEFVKMFHQGLDNLLT